MKNFVKMNGREVLSFCLLSILSGVMIGIGGTASLLANQTLASGKLIGAILFSFGIYCIMIFEMKLFTGMISDMFDLGYKNYWQLAVCFLGNTIGVLLVGALVSFSPISNVEILGASIISQKLAVDAWYLSALCSSALCGVLISLSVKSYLYTSKKGLSATLGVIFPIVVFAFCGFDHSVANMLYFYHLGEFSLKIVAYVLLTILGNVLGGITVPLIVKIKEKAQSK